MVTSTISGSCDVRVIWGGDVTVKRIRSVAIPAHATELVFADRFSMAAIGIEAYRRVVARRARDRWLSCSSLTRTGLISWLCSSAPLLLWVGAADPRPFSVDFYDRVRPLPTRRVYGGQFCSCRQLGQAVWDEVDAEVTGYSAEAIR